MILLGHRGLSARFRENTLLAFVRAIEEGADGVELDVRLCGSGELVVLHDATLRRLWGDPRSAADLSLAEIRRVAPGIPTLADAWEAVGGRGELHLEVKSDRIAFSPLAEPGAPWSRTAVAVAGWIRSGGLHRAPRGLVVSSFDPRILKVVASAVPRVPCALIFGGARRPPFPLRVAKGVGCRAVHPEARLVTDKVVRSARRAKLAVRAWTVDEPKELRRLARLGIDAVISNDPTAARRALSA